MGFLDKEGLSYFWGKIQKYIDARPARAVRFDPGETGMDASNVQEALEELFTSGSEGKALVASAVTAKGVETAADASFETLRDHILAIPSGPAPEGLSTIRLSAEPAEVVSVSGGGMASSGMTVTINAEAREEDKYDYGFVGWQEDGQTVSEDEAYTFPVTGDRELLALFEKYPYVLGVDWWETVMPSSTNWASITYGDGKFVAVANGTNKAAYSLDGINWTETTLPFSGNWFGVTYGNGKFVATADATNKAAYSLDGINWIAATMPSSANWSRVTYGGGKFVAVARQSNKAAYSLDGINWTATTLPSSTTWYTVTYGGGKFVTMSSDNSNAAYSLDGINWIAATMPSSAGWFRVVYGDGKFVAVARGFNSAAYSLDGINWIETAMPSSSGFWGLAYGRGKFVAIKYGDNKAAYSLDGINWIETTMPSSAYWYDIVYGDGKFVAVANTGSNKAAYSSAKGPSSAQAAA